MYGNGKFYYYKTYRQFDNKYCIDGKGKIKVQFVEKYYETKDKRKNRII